MFRIHHRRAAAPFNLELHRNMGNLPQMRKFAITTGATNVEVLAGAGEVEKARELAQRILLVDGSPEAQSLLRQHLDRAGRPEILDRILQTP